MRAWAGGGSKLTNRVEDDRRAPGSSDFAGLLRDYRVAARLSQGALAERAGMHAGY